MQKLLFFLIIFPLFCLAQIDERPQHTTDYLKSHFAEPDMFYAPHFFWFWDRPLDNSTTQKKIVQMAQEMALQRCNPGYVHARMNMVGQPNLPREQWLSPAWMNLLDTCIDSVKKQDAHIGFVDEFWWPSGKAAGRVLENNPHLWAESLYWQTIDVKPNQPIELPTCFFSVAAQKTDSLISSQSLQLVSEGAADSWKTEDYACRIFIFHKYYHPGCDGGRLNYLHRDLAPAFIEQAYKPYVEKFGDALAEKISGVFVDHEGDYGYKMAWSDDLQKHYAEKYQQDIRLILPLLIEKDMEGFYPAARISWFDAVSDLYAEHFQVRNDWLADHDLYAISNLWEESLMWQAAAVGDFMKVQRAFTMPGTDALGLNILNPHDFAETRSVCEFENRRFQSEIMGGAGFWGFTNTTIKQAANAAIAWGIDHIVPHAIFATQTLSNNPWIPDWYTQNPMWPWMHQWSDFVRRAAFVNSQGHSAAQVLIYNPMESVWGICGDKVFDPAFPGRSPVDSIMSLRTNTDIARTGEEMKKESAWWCPPVMQNWFDAEVHDIDKTYRATIETLSAERIDFLVADRHYLGKMKIKNSEFIHESHRFQTLILPAVKYISRKSLEKIFQFAENNGKVIVLNSLPIGSAEKGLQDAEFKQVVQKLRVHHNVLIFDCIEKVIANRALFPSVQIKPENLNILQQHRIINDRNFYWLANNTGVAQKGLFTFPGSGFPQKWNCETGEIEGVEFNRTENSCTINLTFSEFEGFWLTFAEQPVKLKSKENITKTIIADSLWTVFVDSTIQPPVEHPFLPPAEFEYFTPKSNTLQSWQEYGLKQFSGYVDYQQIIRIEKASSKIIFDLGEVQNVAEVWVNQKSCGKRLWPPMHFDISDAVQSGENHIHIRVGNLLNNNFGDERKSGLLGPVKLYITKQEIK